MQLKRFEVYDQTIQSGVNTSPWSATRFFDLIKLMLPTIAEAVEFSTDYSPD